MTYINQEPTGWQALFWWFLLPFGMCAAIVLIYALL